MIVVPTDAKGSVPLSDKPPPYSDSVTVEDPAAQAPSASLVKATNCVYINQLGAIKNNYAINTSIALPESLLPPIPSGEERKNLYLCTRNGSLTSEITLLGKGKATLEMGSMNGSVNPQVHRSTSSPSFILFAHSNNGSVNAKIPRNFRGPLVLSTTNGSIRISEELAPSVATFGDVKGTRTCFVGDFEGYDKDTWSGDELTLQTKNGSVRVSFDDEVAPTGNFLTKFLGL